MISGMPMVSAAWIDEVVPVSNKSVAVGMKREQNITRSGMIRLGRDITVNRVRRVAVPVLAFIRVGRPYSSCSDFPRNNGIKRELDDNLRHCYFDVYVTVLTEWKRPARCILRFKSGRDRQLLCSCAACAEGKVISVVIATLCVTPR